VTSETRRAGLRSVTAAIGMFAIGFLIVAGGIHRATPNRFALHAAMRSEKLALLDQWRGTALSASFGSSHVHYGFDPRAFDAAMAGTSTPTRSINLAIAGGSQSEQRAMALAFVESLSPQQPAAPHAHFVFLELNAGANFTREHLLHPRAINLYDWPTTRFVFSLTSPAMSFEQRAGRSAFALIAMTLHFANVGMVSSRLFPAPLDQQQLDAESIEDRRGLIVDARRPGVLEQLRLIESHAPQQPAVTPAELLPGNRDLAEDLQAHSAVKLVKLQIVYLVMPKLSDLTHRIDYPDMLSTSQGPIPIFNLARPDLYPQLYAPELWFDDAHLDESGARLASTLLAQSLIAWQSAYAHPLPTSQQAAAGSSEAGKP